MGLQSAESGTSLQKLTLAETELAAQTDEGLRILRWFERSSHSKKPQEQGVEITPGPVLTEAQTTEHQQ